MKARTVKIEYCPGERFTVQGVKGNQNGKSVGGMFFQNAGYGVGQAFLPSLLLLHTKYEGKKLVLRIDTFFKERLGKLVESRRELIKLTMPKEVSISQLEKKEEIIDWVEEVVGQEFTHEVITADLEAWLSRITNLSKQEVAKMKKSLGVKRKAQKEKEERDDEALCRSAERAANQRKSRWRKKMEALVVEEGSKYLKATFTVGQHRQTGQLQYEFRLDDKLYVLHRADSRIRPIGEKYVSIDRELVPDRIYLVSMEYCN